jgi:hypothetical protein
VQPFPNFAACAAVVFWATTGGANRTDKPRNANGLANCGEVVSRLGGSFLADSSTFMSDNQFIAPSRGAVRQN